MKRRAGQRLHDRVHSGWRDAAKTNLSVMPILILIVVGTGAILLALPSPLWWRSFLVGFLFASALASLLWFLHVSAGVHVQWLGLMGERATAEAVSRRRMRRLGWHVVSGLFFDGHGDVDHVLVGPGGVFAVESKWTSSPWTVTELGIDGPLGRDPVAQARDGARKVESMLRFGKERFDIRVQPLVVLWGPGAPKIDRGICGVSDVLVAEGRSSGHWVDKLDGAALPPDLVGHVQQTLQEQADRQYSSAPKAERSSH